MGTSILANVVDIEEAMYAISCHAIPCHAMPCHTIYTAIPCHAMPCHDIYIASAMQDENPALFLFDFKAAFPSVCKFSGAKILLF